ncbi:TPA_asm: ftsK-C [Monosiga MELD virus 1]|nr:TPA_asm: ftsK-C [Monosiga MELD virus 1]
MESLQIFFACVFLFSRIYTFDISSLIEKMSVDGAPEAPFQMPFRMLVAGSSGSGKTHATCDMLLSHYSPHQGVERLVWLAPEYSLSQPLVQALSSTYPKFIAIDGSDGWTKKVKNDIMSALEEGRSRGKNDEYLNDTILVIDDMVCPSKRDYFVGRLFTTVSHLGVSLIKLTQRIFTIERSVRTLHINCDIFMLFRFPGTGEVLQLLHQLENKERAKELYDVYRGIINRDKHGYLLIDTLQSWRSPKRIRDSSMLGGMVV